MSDILDSAVTVNEAARMLRVSPSTIWRAIKAGEIPSSKLRGCRRIPVSALQKIITTGDRTGETFPAKLQAAE